ncbi:MAG: metal ABC transporter ATP-binding protein [Polyangiaceae bacterium]|jgi:ABC-type Mn2+/Zn2+ transport system ATPase subunit|nr:metal ABC transporter ATP-binding protein [Polyangiaceae bacterium]
MDARRWLELRDVSIGYREPLVHGISLEVWAGDFFGIVGPNGAGKSTLLLTILGNLPARKGEVIRQRGLRFGYVPQRTRIDPIYPMCALEVVRSGAMGPKSTGKPGWLLGSASRAEGMRALEQVGLASVAHKPLRDLSGGQQQRVLIARALVRQPNVLVLDEPTAGMDIPSEQEVLDFVQELNQSQRTAVIVVVHQIHLVADRAHRMAIINKDIPMFAVGATDALLSSGKLSELYRRPMEVVRAEGHTRVGVVTVRGERR